MRGRGQSCAMFGVACLMVGAAACSGAFSGGSPDGEPPPERPEAAPSQPETESGAATHDAAVEDVTDSGPLVDADASVPRLAGLPESNGSDGTTWKENGFTTLLADARFGARTIQVAAQAPGRAPFTLAVGGVVLVWQTAVSDASLLVRPFAFSAGSSAGRYLVTRVTSVTRAGDALTLALESPLTTDLNARGAQVVSLPQYTDIVLPAGAERRAAKWDGTTGGALAFLARGRVTIEGALSASGAGFGGGASARTNPAQFGCVTTGTTGPAHAAKGSGVAIVGTAFGAYQSCNGGGGGICHNAGGGGGSLVSTGGGGGATLPFDGSRAVGGEGGATLPFAPLERIFVGGGGGAGEQDDAAEGAGGDGGGLLLVGATGPIDVVGTVESSGAPGAASAMSGGGGGGAGGTILLRSLARVVCSKAITARGGSGGNTIVEVGPGGGGSGGAVVIDAPNVAVSSADCLADVGGGSAGTSQQAMSTRGATPGSAGRAAWGPLR